ncbi:MAG: hypothetical protein HY744_15485 [Deltaproteobacteria bacterium]|nr:hypothetical protein [Deltaproteobacteria bacterium]
MAAAALDPDHCGGCNNTCQPGHVCDKGVCKAS